jgi:NADH-quinone oxidoreductase subunit H
LKIIFFCWLQLLIRWTLPRFRFDHLLRLGWKELMPLALLNLVITAIVMVF